MRKKSSSYRMYMFRQKSVPYLFMAPNLLIFTIYIIIPALMGVYYSFTNFDGLNDPKFIGFENYADLVADDLFVHSLINTIKYVAITMPLMYVFALLLALIITQELKARGLFRASYYWPVMISFIVVGVMWQWILGDSFGVFNVILEKVGIGKIDTLTSPRFAWWGAVFIQVWSQAGYYMVLFTSGLLSIPPSIYEAAKIDGANKKQTFFRVTLPMIRSTSLLVIILATMNIFKIYPLIVSFTNGEPYNATRFIVQHIYETAFDAYEVGYASAMSVVMLVIVMIFSGINLILNRRGEA